MNIFNNKTILSMMLAIALAPAAASAGVYFLEKTDPNAATYEQIRPCFVDYPLTVCADNKTPQNFCPTDPRYFRTCGCDASRFKYTSCTDNKTLSGDTCGGKYEACTCDAKYKYDSMNCTGGKVLSGKACSGKYEDCGCPAEYSKTCVFPMIGFGEGCGGQYKTCKCPDNYVTCDNGGAAGAIKCTEESGIVKWSQCKAKPLGCGDGEVVLEDYWCNEALKYWVK